jgi:hypothetical protein
MSTLELEWKHRVIDGAQTPRRFLDFVIDGKSLYEKIEADVISPLGWLPPTENLNEINRLLLTLPADLPNNRNSIYVCPLCADLGCGAVSALIERVGDSIVWRDFGYENNYDENISRDGYESIGPFTFKTDEYAKAIQLAIENQP